MLCLIGLGVAEQIAGFHFMHMYIYMKSVIKNISHLSFNLYIDIRKDILTKKSCI